MDLRSLIFGHQVTEEKPELSQDSDANSTEGNSPSKKRKLKEGGGGDGNKKSRTTKGRGGSKENVDVNSKSENVRSTMDPILNLQTELSTVSRSLNSVYNVAAFDAVADQAISMEDAAGVQYPNTDPTIWKKKTRTEMILQRKRTVWNWNNRKVDLRQEQDVGGALLLAARRFRLHRVPKAKLPTSKANNMNHDEPTELDVDEDEAENANNDENIAMAEDSSDEEQETIMNQLLTASQEAKDAVLNVQEVESEDDEDFWERGLTLPKGMQPRLSAYRDQLFQSIAWQPKPRVHLRTILAGDGASERDEPIVERATLPELPLDYANSREEVFEYFPFRNSKQGDRQGATLLYFIHKRQLNKAAARHMMATFAGGSEETTQQRSTNDRFIRLLWQHDNSAFWKDVILFNARRTCKWFHDFEALPVKSRASMSRFGLTQCRQVFGPVREVGLTLDPRALSVYGHTPKGGGGSEAISTSFVALPGTTPPTPSFPLNASSFVLGPHDRNYANDHESSWDVSEGVLGMALFVGRKLATIDTQDEWGEKEKDEVIKKFLEKLVVLSAKRLTANERKGHLLPGSVVDEAPRVMLHDALFLFASVLSNVPAFDDYDANGRLSRQSSRAIFDVLDAHMSRKCLQNFPRLQTLYGINRLSKVLPQSGSDILARGFETGFCRTPFDLMKTVLQHIECEKLLDGLKASAVPAHVLEFELFRSSLSFRAAVKADPVEPLCHAWHIAAISACLLLCSGNRIESVARLYPSARTKNADRGSSEKYCTHEIRPMLSKFDDLRRELAVSFGLLLDLAAQQRSCRAHMYVASFLEWNQVMVLMTGGLFIQDDMGSPIKHLHASHSFAWAKTDTSAVAQEYIQRFETSRAQSLEYLAISLENDPADILLWRQFVERLGPFSSSSKGGGRPKRSESEDSGMDDHDLFCPSDSFSDEVHCWKKSRDYWKYDLLACRLPKHDPSMDAKFLLARATELFDECPREEPQHFDKVEVTESEEDNRFWLGTIASSDEPDETPSLKERQKSYDDLLPVSFAQVLSREIDDSEVFKSALPEPGGPNSDQLEVLSYKALILAHMFGEREVPIVQILRFLFAGYQESSIERDCPEWKCLVWLYRMGLNVTEHLTQTLVEIDAKATAAVKAEPEDSKPGPSVRGKKRNIVYPREMREAVKEGLKKYGFKKWAVIRKAYPEVFEGVDRWHAVGCYRCLVREGEIPRDPMDTSITRKRKKKQKKGDLGTKDE